MRAVGEPGGVEAGQAGHAGRIHAVVTPEGLILPFALASVGERVSSFVIDLLILALCGTVVSTIGGLFGVAGLGGYGRVFAILAAFALEAFYFIACEVALAGRTIGKRMNRLCVISRDGGPLTVEAVLARNLTRQVEVFIPLVVLSAGPALWPDLAGWQRVLAGLWSFAFLTMPLWNADRLRCGDFVAGTLVVRVPRAVLLPDLAGTTEAEVQARAGGGDIAFSHEQLDIYGIHELQVLEDLLRGDGEGTVDSTVLEDVAQRIQRKIGWPKAEQSVPVRPFLHAFYRAQRGRLERKLLFGRRQERKRRTDR